MMIKRIGQSLILICLLTSTLCLAQDDDPEMEGLPVNRKGFHTGLYIGSYFSDNYTAHMYDGYGFDAEGGKNNYESSFMYQKIILQYGGGYGQTDYIAEALGVNPEDWTFDESDMPTNMRYKTSFLIGFHNRYSVDKNNAVLINISASQLTVSGNFTIVTRPPSGSTQINNSIVTCDIRGKEQRLLFQFGYQRILGENENFNFFVEGGLHATLTKFNENEIMIRDLRINLVDIYEEPGFPAFYPVTKPVGLGFGAFGGFGLNLDMDQKWSMQLVYNPTFEKINIVPDPKLRFQHAVGLRGYYKL